MRYSSLQTAMCSETHFSRFSARFLALVVLIECACIYYVPVPLAAGLCISLCAQTSVPPHEFGEEVLFSTSTNDFGLYIPATVCNTNVFLLLDTGSTISVLDSQYKSCLGRAVQKITAATADEKKVLFLYRQPAISIGTFQTNPGDLVSTIDLTKHRELLDKDIQGLLGMTFLHEYSLEISFDHQYVKFIKGHPSTNSYGATVKLVRSDQGTLSVACNLPTGVTEFSIDSGDLSTGSLSEDTFSALAAAGNLIPQKVTQTLSAARLKTVERGRLSKLNIADFDISKLIFTRGSENSLGLGFLKRFNILIDFPCARLYISRSKYFSDGDPIDKSGLALVRRNAEVVVLSVDKDSPADTAGFSEGDVILRMNDRSLMGMPLEVIRRQFCQGGETYKIIVRPSGSNDAVERMLSF